MSDRNRNRLPVDRGIMSNASSIPQASAEKIDELFGRRFLHNPDAMMAVDTTASPLLDPSVKMRV